MSNKLPVSVHVLTFNSANTLRQCLESVQMCQEILVVDGGSTDGTLAIAQEFNATILKQPGEQGVQLYDFSSARNTGLEHTNQPWILALDSDEYASEELMESINNVIESHAQPAAYYVTRKYIADDGSVIEHATTYPNKRLYFFHKGAAKRWIKPVHERIELVANTQIKHLQGYSAAPLGNLQEYKHKNKRYLQIELQRSQGKGWLHWAKHRLYHTCRSRCIALLKILFIWCIPRKGKRLPLKHELMRFWYGWQLIVKTMPITNRQPVTSN